jgi:phage-related protein
MIRQVFEPRQKKTRQAKNKVKSMLIIFFDIKGSVHKEFTQAVETVNSAYYCGVSW